MEGSQPILPLELIRPTELEPLGDSQKMTLKICGDDVPAFEEFMYKLDDIAGKMNVDCFITSSIAEEELPEGLKKFLTE